MILTADREGGRQLRLWQALALSLGLVAPTLAMSGNTQGLVVSVGKAIPMVFVLGFVAIALVAHGFVRLTSHYNHAGSAYGLVGATIGWRSGFFSGFALLGAYLFFSIATLAAVGAFTNALVAQLQLDFRGAAASSWIAPALIGAVISALLSGRDSRTITRVLMLVEGLGVLLMMVVVVVIFERGGAVSTGFDVTVFRLHGIGVQAAAGGVVAAFLSWAGFEACATLGEETDRPRRNIPFAIFGAVALTGLLFIVVAFAETIGFGTDAAGLAAFQSSANALGSLAEHYVGRGFAAILVFTAVVSAFACHVSSVTAASRIIFALVRDGLGPGRVGLVEKADGPRNAAWAVITVSALVDAASYTTGFPSVSAGDPAIEVFFYFGIAGALCLMTVYLLIEVAAIQLILKGNVEIAKWEIVLPVLGILALLLVFYFNLTGQSDALGAPSLASAWCAFGLASIWWRSDKFARLIAASSQSETRKRKAETIIQSN